MPTYPASARVRRWRRSASTATYSHSGRYVGAEPQPDDGEPFEKKMARVAAHVAPEQQAEARRLDAAIETNLEMLGFQVKQFWRKDDSQPRDLFYRSSRRK